MDILVYVVFYSLFLGETARAADVKDHELGEFGLAAMLQLF